MPTEQGESVTDDPPTSTAAPEEALSVQPEEDTPTVGPGQSEGTQQQVADVGQLQPTHQSHIIQNVEEIFHTIESLLSKLRQLKASLSFIPERRASLTLLGR